MIIIYIHTPLCESFASRKLVEEKLPDRNGEIYHQFALNNGKNRKDEDSQAFSNDERTGRIYKYLLADHCSGKVHCSLGFTDECTFRLSLPHPQSIIILQNYVGQANNLFYLFHLIVNPLLRNGVLLINFTPKEKLQFPKSLFLFLHSPTLTPFLLHVLSPGDFL